MDRFVEDIYDSIQGELLIPVPGVENAFAEGSLCHQLYQDMLDAYARVCERLGCADEDQDVETIINSLLTIQKELCRRMYFYGCKFSSSEII